MFLSVGNGPAPNGKGKPTMIRTTLALLCVPAMRLTGWRFSRLHRVYDTAVYRWIDTVGANFHADKPARGNV
jgi:hypothetical protein